MFTKLKSTDVLRVVTLVGISLIATNCGMQPTSSLDAIRGKTVFRIEARKSILDSQVPSSFKPLEEIRKTVQQLQVTTNSEILGVEILPVVNADRAQFDIIAKIKSNNLFDGPMNAGLIGRGATEGRAIKSVMFDDQGIKSTPATFDGKTVIEVVAENPNKTPIPPVGSGGLIEGIKGIAGDVARTAAVSQFSEKRAEVEKEVYKQTSEVVGKHLNDTVDPTVLKYDGYYHQYFLDPIYSANRFPAYLNFSTTAESVVINGSSEKYGMALPDHSALTDNDLSFQIHEAFINAFFARNIKTFRPMQLADFKAILGSMPLDSLNFAKLEGKMSGNIENVRISFMHGTPVSLKISENLLTFTVRASYTYKILNSDVNTPPADISVAYRIILGADSKLSLKREAIEIKQIDGKGEDSIWGIVKTLMTDTFKEEVIIPAMPIQKPNGEKLQLVPSVVNSQAGWLNMSWKLTK